MDRNMEATMLFRARGCGLGSRAFLNLRSQRVRNQVAVPNEPPSID